MDIITNVKTAELNQQQALNQAKIIFEPLKSIYYTIQKKKKPGFLNFFTSNLIKEKTELNIKYNINKNGNINVKIVFEKGVYCVDSFFPDWEDVCLSFTCQQQNGFIDQTSNDLNTFINTISVIGLPYKN